MWRQWPSMAARWLAFYASVDSYKQHTGNSNM
jgi:hypothetical protein